MITNLLLELVDTIVSAINSLMPHFSLPSYFSGGAIIPSAVTTFLAATLHMVEPFFPSSLLLSVLAAAAALWPAVLAYLVFNWIIRHTPTIAGFGLGAG